LDSQALGVHPSRIAQVPTNPPGKLCTRLFGEETTNYEHLGLAVKPVKTIDSMDEGWKTLST